ncbi:MAG: ferrous iron transport protein A [Bacillota bacterium]|nr:ferrous iron transport protein A [Bacillota bacterium]
MIKNIWKREIKNKGINSDKAQLDKDITGSYSIRLSELQCGNSAKVIKLQGNGVLMDKLKAMGIYAGTIIVKKSAIPAKGPIIVEKGAMQFALGYDIAKNILVECL